MTRLRLRPVCRAIIADSIATLTLRRSITAVGSLMLAAVLATTTGGGGIAHAAEPTPIIGGPVTAVPANIEIIDAVSRSLDGGGGGAPALGLQPPGTSEPMYVAPDLVTDTTFTGLSAGSASSLASTPPLLVGTLESIPGKAALENAAGVKGAMIELNWSAYETSPGVFSASYASNFNKRVDALLAAGQTVTLGLGLHYTPKWVLDLPNGRFVNQLGQASGAANFVFSAEVRQRAANYLAKANAAVNFSKFSAVRISSGARSELLYPSGGTYWAFDTAAQTGVGLPAGVSKTPVPGWKPGTTALAKDQVRSWALWYVDSLASTAGWLTSTVRSLGYDNAFYLLTPGVGVTPVRFDQLTSGTTLANGTLGVGAYWYEIYRQLKDVPGMTAYVSSMADGSGSNDSCSPTDSTVSMFTRAPANWSASRWIARIADEFGLPKSGENPGHQDSIAKHAVYVSTASEGMAGVVFRQARTCGFSSVFWAHDKQLWDGTMTLKDLTTVGGLS